MTVSATGVAARVYNIDTSAIVDVPALPDPDAAWTVIRSLIAAGRLVMCRETWEELERVDPDTFDDLKDVKDRLVLRSTSAAMMTEVGRIQYTYPRMCKPRHRGDRADPYIVAHAKQNGHTVVTDEQNRGGKMPVVCGREGVDCIPLAELLLREGGLRVPPVRRSV